MTGIALNTLKARSAREGWKDTGVRQQAKERRVAVAVSNGQMQPHATCGLDTVANENEELSRDIRRNGLHYAKRVTAHAAKVAESEPEVALAQAGDVKAAIQGAALAGNWQTQQAAGSSVVVQIAMLSRPTE